MLVLHRKTIDGVVVHEDFSRETWEAAIRDPDTVDYWGHRPDECRDPLDVNRERLRSLGYFDEESPRCEVPKAAPPRSDRERIRDLESKIERLRSGRPEQLGLGFD